MTVRETRAPERAHLPGKITITVGIHADAGAEKHVPPPSSQAGAANDTTAAAANDTGSRADLTVADVATFNEFGTSRIPQRSFIRAWVDENADFIQKTIAGQMRLVAAGKLDAETAAERIALACEGSMKQRISRGIPPPNAPATIARKGSSKPLIHTGQLRKAIRGRAVVGEAGEELDGSGNDVVAAE